MIYKWLKFISWCTILLIEVPISREKFHLHRYWKLSFVKANRFWRPRCIREFYNCGELLFRPNSYSFFDSGNCINFIFIYLILDLNFCKSYTIFFKIKRTDIFEAKNSAAPMHDARAWLIIMVNVLWHFMSFLQSFKYLEIKFLIYSPLRWHKLNMYYIFLVEVVNNQLFHCWFAHHYLLQLMALLPIIWIT